jgi:N-acetylglucosaminyl-diphospho-decaprenol L-rhamnosyltransferase
VTARVGVVTITRDRRDELAVTLARLEALPERPPVIVVDNGSTDGTPAMVRARFPGVTLLALGRNHGGAGRNLGMAVAPWPYVAFCDDDTWWAPGSLARAVDILDAHPRTAVLTARIVVEPAGTVDLISEEMAASPLPRPPDLPGAPLLSFLAGASVVRRSALLSAGGFSLRLLIGGEEELLAADLAAAGWGMAYVEELQLHHQASTLRDPHLRRQQGIRNTLWYTWLRRPARSALGRTARLLASVPRDRVSLGAVAQAAAGVPWILQRRAVVPPPVEEGLQALAAGQHRSRARRYVS